MNTIRLYLVIAIVLLWVTIATVQVGAGQFAGASAAAEVPATPDDGGPRNWQVTGVSGGLNLREQPTIAAKIINTYLPGTILDNLGCQRSDGRIWCDVQQLGGGPRGYVAAEFLTPAVSPMVPWQRGQITRPFVQARAISMQRGRYPVPSTPASP